jgi:hypothetical protein
MWTSRTRVVYPKLRLVTCVERMSAMDWIQATIGTYRDAVVETAAALAPEVVVPVVVEDVAEDVAEDVVEDVVEELVGELVVVGEPLGVDRLLVEAGEG